MTVKRYDARIGNGMGLSVPCSEMYENPVCQFVTYSDYQKLVAENARLISLAKGWASSVDDCYFEQHGNIYTDGIDSCNEELSTIAINTDAAIAEIKAQGVDAFANYKKLESEKSGSTLSLEMSIAAKVFAANLRAGRKG